MKKILWGLILLMPLAILAGGNPGNPYREFTVEDTVKWVLGSVERAYNLGLTEEFLQHFSLNYMDANMVSFSKLRNLMTKLLVTDGNLRGLLLTFNSSANVNETRAVVITDILLKPGSTESIDVNLLVTRDTIILNKYGESWKILKASHLTSILTDAVSTRNPIPNKQPATGGNNEY